MAKHHPAHVGLAGRFAHIAVIRKRRGERSNRPEFDVCDFGVASPIARVRSPLGIWVAECAFRTAP